MILLYFVVVSFKWWSVYALQQNAQHCLPSISHIWWEIFIKTACHVRTLNAWLTRHSVRILSFVCSKFKCLRSASKCSPCSHRNKILNLMFSEVRQRHQFQSEMRQIDFILMALCVRSFGRIAHMNSCIIRSNANNSGFALCTEYSILKSIEFIEKNRKIICSFEIGVAE